MYGIFRVDSNFQLILSKDAARLCPELVDISEDELKYIILAYDYLESPFRKKPIEERKRIARRRIWKNSRKTPEKTAKIKKAINAYKSLIYDSKREAVDSYKQKIHNLNMEISKSDDFKEIQEKAKIVSFLESKVAEYETDIQAGEVNFELKLKGDKKLSYVEIWQRNKQAYEKEQKLLGEEVDE